MTLPPPLSRGMVTSQSGVKATRSAPLHGPLPSTGHPDNNNTKQPTSRRKGPNVGARRRKSRSRRPHCWEAYALAGDAGIKLPVRIDVEARFEIGRDRRLMIRLGDAAEDVIGHDTRCRTRYPMGSAAEPEPPSWELSQAYPPRMLAQWPKLRVPLPATTQPSSLNLPLLNSIGPRVPADPLLPVILRAEP